MTNKGFKRGVIRCQIGQTRARRATLKSRTLWLYQFHNDNIQQDTFRYIADETMQLVAVLIYRTTPISFAAE